MCSIKLDGIPVTNHLLMIDQIESQLKYLVPFNDHITLRWNSHVVGYMMSL